MSRRIALPAFLALMAAGLPGPAAARIHLHPPAPKVVPTPRPEPNSEAAPGRPSLTDIPDMSKAVPADQAGKLPTTEERYRALKSQAEKTAPRVQSARKQSQDLKAEAEALARKLVATAAQVQSLEQDKARLDAEIAVLEPREKAMSASFARDRVGVAHLLALLERLQHDTPPVLALTADNAVSSAEQAMLLGASLPRVYGAAAQLARRIDALRRTRARLVARRAEAARNAVQLATARVRLDQLLAVKRGEADTAAARYTSLAAGFATISRQAADLGQLLDKVAALRAETSPDRHIVVVGSVEDRPKTGSLRRPVVGRFAEGGIDGVGGTGAPGITFSTVAGAQVVAPADSRVLFAGPYHKTGQVLILEIAGGYDLVLAGLDRVEVSVGDQLLAGEPVGTMAHADGGARLYFELRHNGKGMSPAPWLTADLRKAERS